MTALAILSAATAYLCGVLVFHAFFSRRQEKWSRNEILLLCGIGSVYLLALLPQWPLWLRLTLAGCLWLLAWRLSFSGRVWQGALALLGLWCAAAAMDRGIFAAYQGLCSADKTACLLTVVSGRTLLLTLAYGCGSIRTRTHQRGIWVCLLLLDLLAAAGALAAIAAEGNLSRGAAALSCGLLLLNGLLGLGGARLERSRREKETRQRLQAEAERNLELAQSYAASFARQRKLTHEFQNQLAALAGLLAQKEYDRAADYIAQLQCSSPELSQPLHTGHAMVDALLGWKLTRAAELGIGLHLSCNNLSGLPMEDGDIVTLLGNVLDNALAASARSHEKQVWVRLWQEQGVCQFVVRNSLPEPSEIQCHDPFHGFGAGLIDAVLKKYSYPYVSESVGGQYIFTTVLG